MGRPRNWLNSVKRKFQRTSQRAITILHSPSPIGDARFTREVQEARAICGEEDNNGSVSSISSSSQKRELTREDIAAIKIQANFRGHLARRAFRALRSLVKLQALVRGVCVRRQARIALHCMHALARLQVRVRARQLLGRCSND